MTPNLQNAITVSHVKKIKFLLKFVIEATINGMFYLNL